MVKKYKSWKGKEEEYRNLRNQNRHRKDYGVYRYRKDIQQSMYNNAKTRARKKGVPFNICKEDIIVPDICPVLKIPLSMTKGKVSNNSPSLDRKIPELGYVKGNIFVLSHKANRLKADMSVEDILSMYKYVSETG